jgi:N,N'-diacetyllegionaminate synthase
MHIGGFDLDERVLVVAEIGNNHEGDLAVARELVAQAAEAGADAVKFQTFRTERFVAPTDPVRFQRLRSFELRPDDFRELGELARQHHLLFISTPLDLDSARVLGPIVDAIKIASGDIDFFPLLAEVATSRKPVILSTGQSELDEIHRAVAELRGVGAAEIAVLHCVSSYPAPSDEINLRALTVLSEQLPGVTIGYSDHTTGLDAAPLAVACGARMIEKHFTLDRAFSEFRDHQLSADPSGLRELVRRVREAELLLGEPRKATRPSEAAGRIAFRRSIAAARDLPQGHIVAAEDLMWIRPGDGLRPGDEAHVVGRRLKRELAAGELVRSADVD